MKVNNSLKFKFLFVLILSNASLALILTGSEESRPNTDVHKYVREGYITLKINAELKTNLEMNLPVTITDKHHLNVIRDVFILQKVEKQHEDLIGVSKTEFLVEIKHKDFQLLSTLKDIYIYPYQLKFKHKKRKSHEIYF